MDVDEVRRQARALLEFEEFWSAVAREKARIKARRPLWQRLFPFVITITRRPS